MFDEPARYRAACWVPSVSGKNIWQALRLCRIDILVGQPDVVSHDADKNFLTKSFYINADLISIRTKYVPVDSENLMSIVERYCDPVSRAFRIIKKKSPDTNNYLAL